MINANFEPLDRERHANIKILEGDAEFGFARSLHLVPLLIGEFTMACKDLPILFMLDGVELLPCALLGPRPGTNAFVDENGRWTGNYVPAYLRRHPFASARAEADREIVLIDRSWPRFSEDDGAPLFAADDRQPTQTLQQALNFVDQYGAEYAATTAHTRELKTLDLFRTASIELQSANGSTATLAGLLAIDERRLDEMSDERFQSLRQRKLLAPLFAHLMSLSNVSSLARAL
jgi:hypothetical protein